eukprot:scaffold13375_cov54-Phaeocystis_antarctica.AAC.2
MLRLAAAAAALHAGQRGAPPILQRPDHIRVLAQLVPPLQALGTILLGAFWLVLPATSQRRPLAERPRTASGLAGAPSSHLSGCGLASAPSSHPSGCGLAGAPSSHLYSCGLASAPSSHLSGCKLAGAPSSHPSGCDGASAGAEPGRVMEGEAQVGAVPASIESGSCLPNVKLTKHSYGFQTFRIRPSGGLFISPHQRARIKFSADDDCETEGDR